MSDMAGLKALSRHVRQAHRGLASAFAKLDRSRRLWLRFRKPLLERLDAPLVGFLHLLDFFADLREFCVLRARRTGNANATAAAVNLRLNMKFSYLRRWTTATVRVSGCVGLKRVGSGEAARTGRAKGDRNAAVSGPQQFH